MNLPLASVTIFGRFAFFLRAAAALPLDSGIVIVTVTVHGVEVHVIVSVTVVLVLVPVPSRVEAGTTLSTSVPQLLTLARLCTSPL